MVAAFAGAKSFLPCTLLYPIRDSCIPFGQQTTGNRQQATDNRQQTTDF
jgi:hypothetical protein